MLSRKVHAHKLPPHARTHSLTYGSRHFIEPAPKYELPKRSMPADVAYRICRDELNLDGNPSLNLASFVTTWMEPEAEKLILETLNKNYIDQDEYPQTAEIHNRCVNMLAHLYHAPHEGASVGTGTVGSSEAIMLSGLALKWKWRERRKAAGLPADRPNLVMGINVQVVWEKFARYFDVEPRYVPLEAGRYALSAAEAVKVVDENTMGVVAILGSTFTGEYEPVAEIDAALTRLAAEKGLDVPIHVDAASGGFVAPFIQPDLHWDFRLPRVKSINVSGHKFGLVYPGVGWAVWRDAEDLPEDLIFHVNYLGGDQPTFNLNFSKGASQVIGQYYNFLRLGREGYHRIMSNLRDNAHFLADRIEEMGRFTLYSPRDALPVVAFGLKEPARCSAFEISDKLRERGWIVPAYTMPPNLESLAILRVVVRESFSRDMAEMLIADLRRSLESIEGKAVLSASESRAAKPC